LNYFCFIYVLQTKGVIFSFPIPNLNALIVEIIKKAVKILAIIIIGLFAIPTTAFIVLQNRQIQTYLAKRVATTVSENLHADFSIESLDLIFFNRVVMKEVLLKDRNNDTLLYSPNTVATLKRFNTSEQKINLSRLKLEQATIRISLDTAEVDTGQAFASTHPVYPDKINNLQFIVDALKKHPDTTQTNKWIVSFEAIDLNNSTFILEHHYRPKEVSYGINFTDLRIEDMDLNINGFRVANDTVKFTIDHLSFREKSGFVMDHLESTVYINKEFFFWRDVNFHTKKTNVFADRIDFRFNKWKDFGNRGVLSKVKLWYSFKPSSFYLEDLAYFSHIFRGMDESVEMSGDLHGRINSFKGDDLVLKYGQSSHFSGSFDLIGLPDFQETYMYFNIEDLTTSIADIETIRKPGAPGETIDLSENLSKLGNISYRGKYAGFYNDFVTYGSFRTDMGKISSDLSIRPDADDNVHFRGELSMEGFDLGNISDQENLAGKLSMEGNVEGVSYHEGGLSAKMDGHISLLELNGYPYQNMDLVADLSNRKFDGSFSIADPNLKMEFFGKIDFTDTLPVFDFTADVDKAMLHPLNIVSTDPSYTLSCYLRANFIGANLNDFDGEITLVNSLFQKHDKQIQIYDFNLFAHHRPDTNQMILKSDLVDAEITGNYEFKDIGKASGMLLAHHLPSFKNIVKAPFDQETSLNNFRFSFHFKNTFPITDFFFPDIEIARDSRISGNYHPAVHELSLTGNFPSLRWKNNSYEELRLNLASDSTVAKLETTSSKLEAGSRINMENLLFNARTFNDEFSYSISWNNHNQAQLYRGEVSGDAAFEFRKSNIFPRMDLNFNESEVVMDDTIWHLTRSNVTIDTTHIGFQDFRLAHASQAMGIEGIISTNPEDKLHFSFTNLNLSQINQAFGGLNLSGILNGTSTISGVYDNLVFLSNLNIDSLSINDELLGNTSIQANWINPEQKIEVGMKAMRGRLKTLGITGDYYPEGKNFNFNITLDKLKLNLFQPYLENLVSDLEGMSNGRLLLTGTLDKPVLNGELSIQKTSFVLDFLQTKYSLSDRIEVNNNNFIFKDIEVFDEKSNRAVLTGDIKTDFLREPEFNINLDAENFTFLNTRETHNQMYYGHANATGRVGLSGSPGNMHMVISAETNRGTHIFIPINQGRDIQENNFITFVHPDTELISDNTEEEYSVDLGGITLDFQLSVTEDATVEIIFDPQVGDVLRGSGNGNIQLSIDPQNGFQIFGEYSIERGEYLFTLQNIINKRLKIQRGGNIIWNGDPTAAIIKMNAIYNSKAAPGVLVPDPPEHLKKRMPVECHLIMEGNLLSPLISFDIVLPTAEEETKNVVRNAITTDEELTKQFLSLLVINNFSSVATSTGGSTGTSGAGMAGVTASELLSNQLSNWLSQISNDFDIGVNYRPGDEISTDQVEVALSTQIFDDRVSIHTNVDVTTGSNAATAGQKTSTIAGDFNVEIKLTDNGRFRLKAYNRYNHDQLYKTSPYTQGVGFVYREDFNSFGELVKRYSDAITGKNRRKKKMTNDTAPVEDTSKGPE